MSAEKQSLSEDFTGLGVRSHNSLIKRTCTILASIDVRLADGAVDRDPVHKLPRTFLSGRRRQARSMQRIDTGRTDAGWSFVQELLLS